MPTTNSVDALLLIALLGSLLAYIGCALYASFQRMWRLLAFTGVATLLWLAAAAAFIVLAVVPCLGGHCSRPEPDVGALAYAGFALLLLLVEFHLVYRFASARP